MLNWLDQNAVELFDVLIRILGLVIGLFGSIAASKLPGKWKSEAEAAVAIAQEKFKKDLHSAAASGVNSGIELGLTGNALMLHALKHMIRSVPEAIVNLTPTPADILKIDAVEEKLEMIPDGIRRVFEGIIRSKLVEQQKLLGVNAAI